MVRAVFEGGVDTATIHYPIQNPPETVRHEGRNYTLVGESEGDPLSCEGRLLRLAGLVGLVAALVLTLFIPLAFKCVRSLIADWAVEICSGRERVIHWHSIYHGDNYQIPVDMAHQFVEHVVQSRASQVARGANVADYVACCATIGVNEEESDRIQFLFRKEKQGQYFTAEELAERFRTMEDDIERMLAPLRAQNIYEFSFKYMVLAQTGRDHAPQPFGASRDRRHTDFDTIYDRMPEYRHDGDLEMQFQWLDFPIEQAMAGNNFITGQFLNTLKFANE
jgi:hypothetical protein